MRAKRADFAPFPCASTSSAPSARGTASLAGELSALAAGTGFARPSPPRLSARRSEEHTSELQSRENIVCRLLLDKKKNMIVDLCVRFYSLYTCLWAYMLSVT